MVILFVIIFGFAHAFFILLRKYDPMNLATTYNTFNSDQTINPTPTLIQSPDSNTNMFNWFPTSLLAMYLLLTGDDFYIYIFFNTSIFFFFEIQKYLLIFLFVK